MLKLQFKDKPNRGFWLVGEQLTLGTNDSCDVVLEGLGINDIHACIVLDGDSVRLEPSEHSPCYVNNAAAGEQLLVEGDELRIGKERLVVVDPKTQIPASPQVKASGPRKNAPVWTLTAQHPKLKDRPLLVTGKSIVGRSKQVSLFIPFKHLSREHAELCVEGDVLRLKDLGSSNGCFVNGERVQEYDLTGGETVSFAFLEFIVNSPVKGPEPATSIDATMVRSAITEEDIAKIAQSQQSQGLSLDLSEIEQEASEDYGANGAGKKTWFGVAVVILLALAYGGYRYFM